MNTITTVRIKNSEIAPTFNALSNLGKLPAGLAKLKIARIIAALLPDARRIELAHRDLIEEYSTSDGKAIVASKRKEFRTVEKKLLDAETTITVEFLSAGEIEAINAKADVDPAYLAFLLTFVDAEQAE